jgi:hypothetical protein
MLFGRLRRWALLGLGMLAWRAVRRRLVRRVAGYTAGPAAGPERLVVGGATLLAGAAVSRRAVVAPFARREPASSSPDADAVRMLRTITGVAALGGAAALVTGLVLLWVRRRAGTGAFRRSGR